jgi:hypothetical protein
VRDVCLGLLRDMKSCVTLVSTASQTIKKPGVKPGLFSDRHDQRAISAAQGP